MDRTLYLGLDKIVDAVDSNNKIICEALPGTARTDAKWRIQLVSIVGTETRFTWANGSSSFTNIANIKRTYFGL